MRLLFLRRIVHEAGRIVWNHPPFSQAWILGSVSHSTSRGALLGVSQGHAEPEETPQEAAFRELKEETHLHVVRLIREEPLEEQYQFFIKRERVFKKVFYFIAEVAGEVKLQTAEIKDGIWLPLTAAIDKLTHSEGKAILTEVVKIL